jgi:transposase
MIPMPSGVQVWLATGHTDMRKGFDGLALAVQEKLMRDPHGGQLFVFRGRRGQHATYRIQFALRDDRISLASPVRANATGLSLPSRQRAEMHLHGRET